MVFCSPFYKFLYITYGNNDNKKKKLYLYFHDFDYEIRFFFKFFIVKKIKHF